MSAIEDAVEDVDRMLKLKLSHHDLVDELVYLMRTLDANQMQAFWSGVGRANFRNKPPYQCVRDALDAWAQTMEQPADVNV